MDLNHTSTTKLKFTYLRICWNAARFYTVLYISLFFIQGLLPAVLTLIEANFINSIVDINTQDSQLNKILLGGLLLISLISSQWMLGAFQQSTSSLLLSKIKVYFNSLVFDKKTKIQYQEFENYESCNIIFLVSKNPESYLIAGLKNQLILLTNTLTILTFVILLYPILYLGVWLLFVLVIPMLILAIKSGQKSYEISRELLMDKRKSDYHFDILNNKSNVSERFLFNYTEIINKQNLDLNENIRKKEKWIKLKWFIRLKISAIIVAIFTCILSVNMFFSVISGTLTIGLFVSLFNALNSLVNKLAWEFTEVTDAIVKDQLFMIDVRKFFDLPEEIRSEHNIMTNSEDKIEIEFNDVSFMYPNSDQYALKNFSFTFKYGTSYSIIGINGSGKSTIVKLLLGLYPTYSGSIRVNQIEIKDYDLITLRKLFSVVFQDFAQYQLSIKEIFEFSNDQKSMDSTYLSKILNVLNMEDFVNSFPNGINTKLGKIYNECYEPSTGQWQKLSIARSLLKECPIYILDEPTASMDPLTEKHIFEDYLKLKEKRLVILISHRLGIAKKSDVILLLDQGKLIDYGDHEILHNRNQLYYGMFEMQRTWYEYENNK